MPCIRKVTITSVSKNILRFEKRRWTKMSLSNRISIAKNTADILTKYCRVEKHKEFVWNHIFQTELKKIVNDDLMHNNPDNLFEEYKQYFQTKNLLTKTIDTNMIFYRGRIGNEIIYGAEDDYNRSFILP